MRAKDAGSGAGAGRPLTVIAAPAAHAGCELEREAERRSRIDGDPNGLAEGVACLLHHVDRRAAKDGAHFAGSVDSRDQAGASVMRTWCAGVEAIVTGVVLRAGEHE